MGDSSKTGGEGESKGAGPLSSSAPWSGTPKAASPAAKQQSQHERLKEYEAKRRLAYSSKVDSMSLYWKAYRDLLSASVSETSRAQRLVLGTCKAHQIYSNAMKAMYKDVYLDEKGNIANEKQQKKLSTSRKTEFRQIPSNGDKQQQTPILKEIRDAQNDMALKVGENAKMMDNEIAAEMGALLNNLKRQFSEMERLGSAILSELEKTEQEVVASWGSYLRGQSAKSGMSPTSPQETAPKNGEPVDPWLVEMQYRVSVAYQNRAWEKGNAELTKLFAGIKQEEMLRRINLREFLVAFVQRQERMFVSLPGLHNSVLDELMGKEMSKEEMEADFRAAIAARAAKLQKPGLPTSPTATAEGSKEDLTIDSPILSDLLVMSKVVLRRVATAAVNRKSLAVVTSDFYLHMFDVDQEKVNLGEAPETVFQMLLPKVIMPTAENYMSGVSNFNKGWSDTVVLSDSIILGKTTFHQKNDTTFELTEVVESKGASKMFVKSARKKVVITTASKEETEEWMEVLTA